MSSNPSDPAFVLPEARGNSAGLVSLTVFVSTTAILVVASLESFGFAASGLTGLLHLAALGLGLLLLVVGAIRANARQLSVGAAMFLGAIAATVAWVLIHRSQQARSKATGDAVSSARRVAQPPRSLPGDAAGAGTRAPAERAGERNGAVEHHPVPLPTRRGWRRLLARVRLASLDRLRTRPPQALALRRLKANAMSSTPTAELEERCRGAVLGLALGDALGAPHEGGPIERLLWRVIGSTRDGRRRFTDDTQMELDLADSLLRCGKVDQDDLAKTFAGSYRWSRGYGPAAARVLKRIRSGRDWREANRSVHRTGSFGNGGAMRAPIVGVFFHAQPENLVTAARQTAEMTHAHPLAMDGAAMIAVATSAALAGAD